MPSDMSSGPCGSHRLRGPSGADALAVEVSRGSLPPGVMRLEVLRPGEPTAHLSLCIRWAVAVNTEQLTLQTGSLLTSPPPVTWALPSALVLLCVGPDQPAGVTDCPMVTRTNIKHPETQPPQTPD